jgi:SAM-dependent methyltransferase
MFDGQLIPYADSSFDAVLFVDVLHHTTEPTALLAEAVRVARQAIVIKDHTPTGFLAQPTLRFMDRTSNARYGVLLPGNYWPREKWLQTFENLRLRLSVWNNNLQLYPRPADWVFGRSLHFVARLDCNNQKPILNDLRMPQPSRALRESPGRL